MTKSPLHSLRPALAVTAGKLAGRASLAAGRGGGTSLPGLVAQRIAPDITATLAAGLPHGSLAVAGTNGKTTTSAMLAAILEGHGLRPVHNRAGANLLRGVASTLLAQAGPTGRLRTGPEAIGLFESDEAALPAILGAVRPSLVVVTNLFRDQLDRYGELDVIAGRWRMAFALLPPDATLVLNADDPLVASLGEEMEAAIDTAASGARRRVIYYGLDLPQGRFARPPESADSISCRRCGVLLGYTHVYYGHLGHYACPCCGWSRPRPAISGRAVLMRGLEGSEAQVSVDGADVTVDLHVPGVYNAYNALAALAGAYGLGIPAAEAGAALARVGAAFGRAERVRLDGHDVWLLLIKNPTGADEVLRLLADLRAPLDVLAVLNDNAADGHDVSWIWDTTIEDLVPCLRHVTYGGTRAEDMALRFKYAGHEEQDTVTLRDPLVALDRALAAAPDAASLYVVATYTAMLQLRRGLVARGVVRHYLERE